MTPKQPRADEYPTDWQSQLKILISAWVHRLVKFGQCKASKEGWTVFECPELEPFIEDLLAARDQEIVKSLKAQIDRIFPFTFTTYVNENERRASRGVPEETYQRRATIEEENIINKIYQAIDALVKETDVK